MDTLSSRLHTLKYRAAIVGPHGTGKSTLLAHLVPRLGTVRFRQSVQGLATEQANGNIIWLQLRRKPKKPTSYLVSTTLTGKETVQNMDDRTCDRLGSVGRGADHVLDSNRAIAASRNHWGRKRLLVLDGYEQLNPLQRLRTLTSARLLGMGMLVTSHRITALPTLCRTEVSLEEAQAIVNRILFTQDDPSHSPERFAMLVRESNLRQLLVKNNGNMREVLMDLYDQFERIDSPFGPGTRDSV